VSLADGTELLEQVGWSIGLEAQIDDGLVAADRPCPSGPRWSPPRWRGEVVGVASLDALGVASLKGRQEGQQVVGRLDYVELGEDPIGVYASDLPAVGDLRVDEPVVDPSAPSPSESFSDSFDAPSEPPASPFSASSAIPRGRCARARGARDHAEAR